MRISEIREKDLLIIHHTNFSCNKSTTLGINSISFNDGDEDKDEKDEYFKENIIQFQQFKSSRKIHQFLIY